jgi:hypothetical protein
MGSRAGLVQIPALVVHMGPGQKTEVHRHQRKADVPKYYLVVAILD